MRFVLLVAKLSVLAADKYIPFAGTDDPVGIKDAAVDDPVCDTAPVSVDVPETLRLPVSVTPGVVMPADPSSVIAMLPSYSYRMLIEPAVKVAVPLDVVATTLSNAPERTGDVPAPEYK